MAEGMFQGMSMFDVASNENAGIRDRALQAAQLGRGRVAVYAAGLEGGMMAQGLARMAGMKTPEEEKAEAINTIMSQNANRDPNNPADLLHISRQFVAAGLPNYAQQFRDKARDVEVQNRTSAQTDRELDQRDARLTFDKEKFKGDTEYRTSTLEFQDRELEFREEKEQTRIQELADQLALDKAELQRKLKTGEFQEIVGKDGNTALYQITSDEEGNVSIKPVTIDVVQASSGGGATQGSSTTATTTSNVGYQSSDGALITKYADATDPTNISEGETDIYKNLLASYEDAFTDESYIGEGTRLAIPSTGDYQFLEGADPANPVFRMNWMFDSVIQTAEAMGSEINSMYDLYIDSSGNPRPATEAIMRNNGMGGDYEANLARFQREGDTTEFTLDGRQTLMQSGEFPLIDAGLSTPIMFDIKLSQDVVDKGSNKVLAKKGQTLEEVIFNAKDYDISFRQMEGGNITGITSGRTVESGRGMGDKNIQTLVRGILASDEAFAGVPEITGTARLPERNYGNQNVRNPEVTAELIGNKNNTQSSTVMGDTTEFDKVVQENGNILADTVKDIKEFVIDIFKPSEHKDSAPENPVKSGFGSDKWALRLLSIKVPQFETAEQTEDGRYQLKMPPIIEVKDEKHRDAYTKWKNLNFNYFFRQGITLPNARIKQN